MNTTISAPHPNPTEQGNMQRPPSIVERATARLGSWRILVVSGLLFAAFAGVFFA